MTHLTDDELLLHAYEELADSSHLLACAECRERLARLEEARVALAWGLERRPAFRARRFVWLALPAAALIGALLLARAGVLDRPTVRPPDRPTWRSHLVGSPYASYVTGGAAFIAIDSQLTRLEQQLTRLEQGRTYGSPRN